MIELEDGTSRFPTRVMLMALLMLGCSSGEDRHFLAIDSLSAPSTAGLGVPIRITAVGGDGVQVDVRAGALDTGERSACISIGESSNTVLVVKPDDVEALVIARLFSACGETSELASEQKAVRTSQSNSIDAGLTGGAP